MTRRYDSTADSFTADDSTTGDLIADDSTAGLTMNDATIDYSANAYPTTDDFTTDGLVTRSRKS